MTATLSLKVAVDRGRRSWYIGVVCGYIVAFSSLAWTLSLGLAIGVVYGIWAASGVALTAVLARVLLREPLTRVMAAGIMLIVAGVWLVEVGH
ncbi:DMT family transporter [Rhodococcus sp. 05-340-2]|uniref:DMT family transporter n=1 Tax=Nocardiaceae TaxID=85025 RepID=UPI003F8F0BE1